MLVGTRGKSAVGKIKIIVALCDELAVSSVSATLLSLKKISAIT